MQLCLSNTALLIREQLFLDAGHSGYQNYFC